MTGSPDISVVIVNFNSGEFLPRCIDSLLNQNLDSLEQEILVVDNASTLDQSDYLREAERRGCRVLRNERNTGYAGGCNAGMRTTSGRFVFFLNADVLSLGDTLPVLIDVLETHPEAGLVEPRTYLDEGRALMLPEFQILSPIRLVSSALDRVSRRAALRSSLNRLRRSLTCWRATEPRSQSALTGAFLGVRREVLEEAGGFDETYPLFFEDFALFRRVRRAGRKLLLVPQAEAVHFAHRSVLTVFEEAMRKSAQSRTLFLRKEYGWWAVVLDRVLESAIRLKPRQPLHQFEDLGRLSVPPVLDFGPIERPTILELSLDPAFHVAVGHISPDGRYAFSDATWNSLAPLRFHARALDAESLELRGAWSFRKI